MKKVPATGSSSANLMIVGESPGSEEVRQGEPFIGPSGKMLDRALTGLGLEREEIWITNAVKYQPKGDKEEFFFSGGSPTPAFMEGILELASEIKTVQPRVILAFGSYAMWALTQESGVTTKRGTFLLSKIPPGYLVLPTLHPAWYLRSRQFHKTPIFEWDLTKAVKAARKDFSFPQAEFLVQPADDQIAAAVDRLLAADRIVLDTEWYTPDALAYIGFSDSKDWAICFAPDSDFKQLMLRRLLESPVPKVMQNAMFDVVALARSGYRVENVRDDTMVAWHWCWPRLGEKSLGFLTSVLTDWPYYKSDVEFIGEDDKKGQIYCCTDCVVTFEAMERIEKEEFPATGGQRGYEISMSISDLLLESSIKGILVNEERRRELETFYTERADRTEKALGQIIGHPINCNSGPQVTRLVFDEIGIKGQRKRTSRQEVLMDIAASEEREDVKQILTAVVKVRRDRKIVSNFLHKGVVDHDGRARTNWNLANTLSGRLSTTTPWWAGLPFQTVPEDAREICIPDPGHIFIGYDYAQAEARYVAAETRDYDLLEAMDSGKDIHAMLAPILSLTYEDIMRMVADALKRGESKDSVRERYMLKRTRHSMNYMQTWPGLKANINRYYIDTGIGVTAREAKRLASGYLELNPGLESWWMEILKRADREGFLENAFGRRVSVYEYIYPDSHLHRSLVSYRPQSSISDLNTICISEAAKEMPWATFLIHTHDGGIFQVPLEREEEAKEIIAKKMTRPIRAGNQIITIPVEVKSGRNWKELD